MAHHQRHRLERVATDPSAFANAERVAIPEEDEAADVDEPPEQHVSFARNCHKHETRALSLTSRSRSQSLLTQGLLVSPGLRSSATFDSAMRRVQSTASNDSAFSGFSTAELTSDGGLTSPARTSTPSPPLPSAINTGLSLFRSKTLDSPSEIPTQHPHISFKPDDHVVTLQAPQPQAPRKRCITFATCATPKKEQPNPMETETKPAAETPKRKTCLKFACPLRPGRESEDKEPPSPRQRRLSPAPSKMLQRKHRDSVSTVKEDAPVEKTDSSKVSKKTNPEGLRFHEFAASRPQQEAWLSAAPSSRQKITVTDCLRKENAIRKIGEEAEEEALEEEEDEDNDDLEDELRGSDDEEDSEDEASDDSEDEDDGNETDDEEGFAASDDDSDAGSEFQFWTPAATTAATSVEMLEHIRPHRPRTASDSSIGSHTNERHIRIENPQRGAKHGKAHRQRRGSPKMRPGTPELPDSTDFVCGTFDEDQPLEAAYLSCMEQRRIAKHGILPQDVDPSFPTSEPEDEEDEDEEDVDDLDNASDSHVWIPGRPDESDGTPYRGRAPVTHHHRSKSPSLSPPKRHKSPQPRRAKSPAPQQMTSRRGITARSPPPRRLFGRSPVRNVSPVARLMHPSPPSSRRNSPTGDVPGHDGVPLPHLAQRPHLTHTKSLPRTPNPFWQEHRRRRLADLRNEEDGAESSSTAAIASDVPAAVPRGPIEIVQGLEQKRQRRKEKFWRQHCRQAAKERPRRPQPGKGAERMRELGLEVADRTKGYGQRLQLVLSI